MEEHSSFYIYIYIYIKQSVAAGTKTEFGYNNLWMNVNYSLSQKPNKLKECIIFVTHP